VLQEAGADSKLELAFTLADGIEYVRAAQAAGLEVNGHTYLHSFICACINTHRVTYVYNQTDLRTHLHVHTRILTHTQMTFVTDINFFSFFTHIS
jgi:Methylmalonyl-CoA mutase